MQTRVSLAIKGDRSHRMPGNRILNAEEARLMLGIGRNTLYEWCAQGIIPHKRVGGKIDEITGEIRGGRLLFSEKLLLEWIENRDNEN